MPIDFDIFRQSNDAFIFPTRNAVRIIRDATIAEDAIQIRELHDCTSKSEFLRAQATQTFIQ